MPKDEFENWVDIDKDVEVVATMTLSEICKEVTNDDSKLSKESECNIHTEEEISEPPPTNAQLQNALLQLMPRYKMRYEVFVVVFNTEQRTLKNTMNMRIILWS